MINIGIVLSDKMNKTRIVLVKENHLKNKLKNKISFLKKINVHDEYNESQYNNIILFKKSRPISRNKHHIFFKIIR